MNRRQIAEARYDTMPDAVAERVYRDPLARRLAEAEGQAKLMTRFIREEIWMIRCTRSEPVGVPRREEIHRMWEHRRVKQAEARDLRLAIAARGAQLGLGAAQ